MEVECKMDLPNRPLLIAEGINPYAYKFPAIKHGGGRPIRTLGLEELQAFAMVSLKATPL